jgi:hypothetical protein
VDAELELGADAELVAELEGLVAEQPTRERLAGQLMLALYRCGRQADALDVYQRTRARLAEDLGLEPGPSLKALQAQILSQAPSPAPASPVLGSSSRTHWVRSRRGGGRGSFRILRYERQSRVEHETAGPRSNHRSAQRCSGSRFPRALAWLSQPGRSPDPYSRRELARLLTVRRT